MRPRTEACLIEHAGRKAIISGCAVQLFKLRYGDRKRTQESSVWPEMTKLDAIDAWNAALVWVRNGYIETGEHRGDGARKTIKTKGKVGV